MKFKRDLVNKLAKKHRVDPRVAKLVVDYPFLFAKRKMANDEESRPIRLRYFGVFDLKQKYKDEETKIAT